MQSEGAYNSGADADAQLIVRHNIKMKQQQFFVCLLHLKTEWKLKTKFKYNLKNCSLEKQKQMLLNESPNGVGDQRRKIIEFRQNFHKVPFS